MASAADSFDLVVIGLGAVGSSTLYQASKSDARVHGIDRYDPPHDFGSTNAETRITRLAVGEGPQYVPFVARSHQIWSELTLETGEQLYHQSGGCIITPQAVSDTGANRDRWTDFARVSANNAAAAGIDFEMLSASQTRTRFPQINVGDDSIVGYEPTGGVVMAENAVKSQLQLAKRNGATVSTNEEVVDISVKNGIVRIRTTLGSVIKAASAVVATGPWFAQLAAPVDRSQTYVTRQAVFWFRPDDPEMFRPDRFPFTIWSGNTEQEYFSSFPMPHGGIPGVKVLTEQFVERCDPSSVDRTVTNREIDEFYHRFASTKIEGLTSTCVKAMSCLYTMTADEHFLIDVHPQSNQLIFASPCSGHGFKHSAAIGEALAQRMLTGTSENDLEVFGRRRLMT